MPDPTPDCERWQETISLLASGCCPAEEEHGVRGHLAACSPCAARFAEVATIGRALGRGRPRATAQAAAVRDRWEEAAAGIAPLLPSRRMPSPAAVLGGALAVSLLGVAMWWGGQRSTHPPPPPRLEPAVRQPTLWDYELALARSDDAFEALLRRDAESVVFERVDPRSLEKEFLQ